MDIKYELDKFSKSITDSSIVLVKLVNVDSMANGLKNVQEKIANKLEKYSTSLEEKIKTAQSSEPSEKAEHPSKRTEDLDLSVTVKKALVDNGLDTVQKIAEKTDEELLALKGIGIKAVDLIRKAC
jgi:DNA-directed RNA polymerase alpha subunit